MDIPYTGSCYGTRKCIRDEIKKKKYAIRFVSSPEARINFWIFFLKFG